MDKKMAKRFQDILDDCIERALQGESVEQCLARYPEQAAELEPLLRVALSARTTSSAVEPRPEFKARVRHEVQSQLRAKGPNPEPKMAPVLHWMPRWAMAAVTLVFVVLLAGTTTVAASSGSLPGDTLYPVKTATEEVHMRLTFSKAAKANLQASLAERRVREIALLAAMGRTARVEALTARFEAHLENIQQLAAQIGATNPQDVRRISRLRVVLYTNMTRDVATLDAAEAKAPLRYKSAIAVAKSRLIQEYDKAIAALDDLQNQQQGQSTSTGFQVQAHHVGPR
jgi:hypothetical protein